MADEKITLMQLRKSVARKTGEKEEVLQTFLNELFQVVVEGLKRDGWVRISGLGQFKVQQVAERKSVNVQTGEKIVIEGYKKVVFVPEVALKNKVNEPYQHLSAIQIEGAEASTKTDENLPLQKLGEQADEINDILAELVQMDSAIGTQTQMSSQAEESETTAEESKTTAELVTVEEVVAEPVSQTPVELEKVTQDPSVEVSTVSGKYEYQQYNYDVEPEKKSSRWKWIIIILVLLVLGAASFCLWYWLSGRFEQKEVVAIETEVIEDLDALETLDSIENLDTLETLETIENLDTVAESVDLEPVSQKPKSIMELELTDIDYSDTLTVEEVIMGTRLAQMARRNYGSPHFWVYIYQANKDKLKTPHRFPLGMQIVIPRLPDSLVNRNNPRAVERAKQFEKELLGE
ncbi:MAG: HU family DNA-binding protein [Paludibacteraceae bacterium]|nr:HU family DNA-binding protein [Paludibacteraceae bacterium]